MKLLDPAIIENLRRCAAEGMTITEAAADQDLTYHAVRRYADCADGIEFAPAKRGRKPLNGNLSGIGQRYAACAAEGLSVAETAARTGRTYGAVSKWANNNPEHVFAASPATTAERLDELAPAVRDKVKTP
jgi:hypothetical protein